MPAGAVSTHWAPWHVHFNGLDKIEGHICEAVREFSFVLRCPDNDADAEGNCPHVQIKPCDCQRLVPCDAHDTDAQARVDVDVQRDLAAGSWPACPSCGRADGLGYMGLVDGAPTFLCSFDRTVFAMDLKEG